MLTAFQWEESTADAIILRAVCGFWEALTVPEIDVDEVVTNAGEEVWWLPGEVLLGTATTVAVPSIFTGILGCDRLVQNSILFS
jgi:hypothetical protein